ncbi:unnamed protein product [Rotaria sordida]|uniref:Uncharacterized protein n=1 Tax=Rotaria sordida TaxID=392033 RepID=A0A815FXL7_9BILA|nr:unnamed protein product [Rotaria sordida]
MDIAVQFGRFPQRPSDLFLKLFYGVICTLERDRLAGCVSPRLVGVSGVTPLTIISTIPDILHHYYHVIVHAQKEVLFATVDRKIALLNSNNIDDRPNLEMMVHYEGDIVNSFYDTFLISWWIPFQPDLVCLREEALAHPDFHFGVDNTTIASMKRLSQQVVAHDIKETDKYLDEPFPLLSDEEKSSTAPQQESRNVHLPDNRATATDELTDNIIGDESALRSNSLLTDHLNKSCTAAQSTKFAANLSPRELEKLLSDFTPFIIHTPHQPFPIALINRFPHGTPIHTDIANPQDAAWLGAFRYAQKSIFIQSPTFNASPAIDGIIAACRRGIRVILWLGLGFNDLYQGFGTFQGGTNENVVKKIYGKLRKGGDGAEKYLETFWYVGKG